MTTWSFSAGLPETKCGFGSKLASTESVREFLPRILTQLKGHVLLDAPCGDGNWMSVTDISMVHYIAADIDPSSIVTYISKRIAYPPLSRSFAVLDMVNEALPKADIVLCRDFLQHLPFAQIFKVLSNVRSAHWFLATSHLNSSNLELEHSGGFRPLNLTAAPFNFPKTGVYVEDGENRILGLWSIKGA